MKRHLRELWPAYLMVGVPLLLVAAVLLLAFTNVWPAAHDVLWQPTSVTVCPIVGQVVICP